MLSGKLVPEAGGRKKAVELICTLTPDIVVLDLSLSVMNGIDVARHIIDIAPKTKIVLFTIEDSKTLREDARRMGIHSVVSKCGKSPMNALVNSLRKAPNDLAA